MATKKTARDNILQEKTVKAPRVHVDPDKRIKGFRTMSVASIAIFVAICLVANLLIYFLLDKPLTFDATSVRTNTIGGVSKSVISNLEKKVEIIGLFDENDQSLDYADYFLPILEDYEAKSNGKVEVRYVDPDINPFILTELDPEGVYHLTRDSFVFKCGDRMISISPYQCFVVDDTWYSQYGVSIPVTNMIERTFTGYISYVASGISLHAYYLTGHNEETEHMNLDSVLLSIGMISSDLSLSGEDAKIPDDCELIIILEPAFDITLVEKELLKSYLDNGGTILLVNDFKDNEMVSYSNLNDICMKMGVSMEQGLLHENDVNYLYSSDDPYYSIGEVASDYAEYIGVPDKYTTQYNRYIKINPDRDAEVIASPLVLSSTLTSVDFQNLSVEASVSQGQYPIVMQCVDMGRTVPSCLLVFGTETFTSDEYYNARSLKDNNAILLRNCLADVLQAGYGMQIEDKSVPNYVLTKPLSSSEATWWSILVMTLIPVGSLICGIYTFRKRRHL